MKCEELIFKKNQDQKLLQWVKCIYIKNVKVQKFIKFDILCKNFYLFNLNNKYHINTTYVSIY